MKKKVLTSLITLLFICQNAISIEEMSKITLQGAIDIAASNSIDLQTEKLNIEISKNKIKQAGRFQNPQIHAYWNIGNAGSGNPHTIGVSQLIEVFKRKHRKKTAQAELKVSEENARYRDFDLKMDVREAYINVVAAKSILKSLEEEKKMLEDIDKLVRYRHSKGSATETDVIQADISLNHIKTLVNNASTNIMAARFNFNSVMDTDPIYDTVIESFESDVDFNALLTPPPKSTLPTFSEILAIAQQNRYDLKIAQKEIDVAKNNLKIVSSQKVPDIEIQAGYLYQPIGMSGEGKFLHGAYTGASLVNLPLLYNFAPEIKNAKLEIEKAELNYAAAQNNAYANLSSAYEKLLNARVNLNYYTDSLIEDSKRMMQTSKRNYELGKTDLTSLIVIEQSYRSIILGYTYALTHYYTCWINFLREVDVETLESTASL